MQAIQKQLRDPASSRACNPGDISIQCPDELASKNITVNAVSPGVIKTEMSKRIIHLAEREILAQIPLKRFGEPEEIADVILFLASDKSSYITGANINVNGGQVMG